MVLAELVGDGTVLDSVTGDAATLLADLAAVNGVLRPVRRMGRGKPEAGESVALSGPDAA